MKGTLFMLALLCACNAQEPVSESKIVGGMPVLPQSPVSRHTVLFTARSLEGLHGCTATLLDASHALTAKHCLLGTDDGPELVLAFGIRWSDTIPTRRVVAKHAHPSRDVAVISFTGGLPNLYTAVKLASTVVVPIGTPIIQAGYGKTSYDSDGRERGILRSVISALSKFSGAEGTYQTYSPLKTICGGDSGGPDFVSVRGEIQQIGVHSGGDCHSYSYNTDVRPLLSWIRSTGVRPQVGNEQDSADQVL